MNEIELKFKLNSIKEKNAAIQKLKKLKAKRKGFFSESNQLFDFENLALSKADCVMRLRKINNECFLTFKGPLKSSQFKERTEIEFKVKFIEAKKIFNEIGLKEKFVYEKKKEIFELKKCKIDVAELPSIGCWIEIEGNRKAIVTIAKLLGFDLKNSIVKSFPALLREKNQKKTKWCFK